MEAGASCLSLHTFKKEKEKHDRKISELITSCQSLSKYEATSFRNYYPQVIATLISALFHIVVGIGLAYSAVLLPQIEDPKSDFHVTKYSSSWIASCLVLVVPVGAIVSGSVMDTIGRLNTLRLATLPAVVGWMLIATSKSVLVMIIGRLLTGFASALGVNPALVYITEIASPNLRGALISLAPALSSLGMVISYAEGSFLHWGTIAWLSLIFAIMPILLLFLIPESPVWLMSRGKVAEAKKALRWFYRYQGDDETIEISLADIHFVILQKEYQTKLEQQERSETNKKSHKLQGFLKPTGYKPLLILLGLFLFQMFAGIYITLCYAVNFFEETGSGTDPYLASILIGVIRFILSLASSALMRKFTRRSLIMISEAGMAISMIISGIFTYLSKNDIVSIKWIPALFILIYVICSSFGLLTIPWTMTAELFPLEIRGVAHSFTMGAAHFLMFLSIKSYTWLYDILDGIYGVQLFFAAVSLIAIIYTFVFLPETHGKKLTEIEEYFLHNVIYSKSKTSNNQNNNSVQARSPIVKNSRVSEKDFASVSPENDQNEKMIENVF